MIKPAIRRKSDRQDELFVAAESLPRLDWPILCSPHFITKYNYLAVCMYANHPPFNTSTVSLAVVCKPLEPCAPQDKTRQDALFTVAQQDGTRSIIIIHCVTGGRRCSSSTTTTSGTTKSSIPRLCRRRPAKAQLIPHMARPRRSHPSRSFHHHRKVRAPSLESAFSQAQVIRRVVERGRRGQDRRRPERVFVPRQAAV